MGKIRFFIKGMHTTFDLVLIATIWALSEKNTRLENEIKDLTKQNPRSPYCFKKQSATKSVPKEQAKYPIGFASVLDISRNDND